VKYPLRIQQRNLKLPFSSQDSAVGIATGYGLDDRKIEVRVPVGSRIFSFRRRQDRLWGPPNLLSNEYWDALSLGGKSAEFKENVSLYTHRSYAFKAYCLISSLLHIVQTGSGVHPISYKMGTRGPLPGVKRQGREADHSPPTSAEVKKIWIYTTTPLYVCMA
jgi:hypothetical protein